MITSTTVMHPITCGVQKIALYETKARFYIVGSNNTQTKFRILKIDRTEPRDLVLIDDKIEYNQREVRDLLTRIDLGNRLHQGQKSNSGLSRTVSAFGIVGFIKFLEGYYLILITKRRRVAIIGHHVIYKVEDATMVYIPNDSEKTVHPDESRYVRMFQNVDLSSNFYFSYSYDLTHTLQYNLTVPKQLLASEPDNISSPSQTASHWEPQLHVSPDDRKVENAEHFLESIQPSRDNQEGRPVGYQKKNSDCASSGSDNGIWSEMRSGEYSLSIADSSDIHYGVRTQPNGRFVWNSYLLEPVELCPDWLLYVIHGFVGQSNISVYGRPIYITLIARRSQKFAGTRFLKRGANSKGDVANEVETEQIVHDSAVSSFQKGRFTAFVQMRGSIPSQWSQDTSKMVPKPAISLDSADPYCQTAGQHFNDLLHRYGAPIIALNLVKKREKKKHESMLSEEYMGTITYLNQFLPPRFNIEHIGFDMARINKLKEANVMARLSNISYYVMKRIGIFQSWARVYIQQMRPQPPYLMAGGYPTDHGQILQTGIVRVNCVDCLDRTNTAQFALGKCALAFQLYALGVLQKPALEFDTDSVRMLEELYEAHGDTLALQYGGSQLVHRIKTYRKIAPISSHSRDIMQTLSRYYSNTFSDADKQNAINLFLGIFKPDERKPALWDLSTDFYLHNLVAAGQLVCHRNQYSCWWNEDVIASLPRALQEVQKASGSSLVEVLQTHRNDDKIDGFFEHYRPYEISVLSELYAFNISHSVRDFMPNFATDYSPFSVRVRPGKLFESLGGNKPPNPSVSGVSSTTSTASSTSDTDSGDTSDEDQFPMDSEASGSSDSSMRHVTLSGLFPSMKQTYGIKLKGPRKKDMELYRRYVNIGEAAGIFRDHSSATLPHQTILQSLVLSPRSIFCNDSSYETHPPTVSRSAREVYATYVDRQKKGASLPISSSLQDYKFYCTSKLLW